MRRLAFVSCFVGLSLAACGDDGTSDSGPIDPTPNAARGIASTQLALDVTAMTGTATITFEPSDTGGATLEVGDLMIESVQEGGVDLAYVTRMTDETTLNVIDLALPRSSTPRDVTITYRYSLQTGLRGVNMRGWSFAWPYYCGNIFPCHSEPGDGTEMTLELTGVPADKTAVYPASLSEAPSYQLAFAIETYTEVSLGTTTAGTEVVAWHLPGKEADTMTVSEHQVAVVDWLEQNLGPYRFGPRMGSVEVRWTSGAVGGMEHHPYWHIDDGAWLDKETHAHEAAHGWYGDGIRVACWEDFVLSEGTTTYLAARALDVVAPTVGTTVWNGYLFQLNSFSGTELVWPEGCNEIDIIGDDLFSNAPYIRGAYFYRGVADKVGAELLDAALSAFYMEHQGKAAHMADMLETIEEVTGYDPTACAEMWLRSTTVPAPGACP